MKHILINIIFKVYDNRMFKNPVPYIEDMMEINSREEDCDFTETKIKD